MIKERKRIIVVAGIMLAVVVLCVYFFFDPSGSFFPRCPFYVMTGWQCPGCGVQRAMHALLHGDVVAAWHFNAAVFLLFPVIVVLLSAEFLKEKHPQFYWIVNSRNVLYGIAVTAVLWWVLRNLC